VHNFPTSYEFNCSKPFAQNGDEGCHKLLSLDSIRPQTAAHKTTNSQTTILKFCTTQGIVQTFVLLIFMFEPLNKALSSRGLADDDVRGGCGSDC